MIIIIHGISWQSGGRTLNFHSQGSWFRIPGQGTKMQAVHCGQKKEKQTISAQSHLLKRHLLLTNKNFQQNLYTLLQNAHILPASLIHLWYECLRILKKAGGGFFRWSSLPDYSHAHLIFQLPSAAR